MNYEFSLWGIALLTILLVVAVAVFFMIDRREMQRILKVFALAAIQVAVVGTGVWAVFWADAWWASLLWVIAMMVLSIGWCFYRLSLQQWKHWLLPVISGLFTGLLVGGGSAWLCLPGRCFVPVVGVIIAQLVVSLVQTLLTYHRSLQNTIAHRQYLMANGASDLEAIMPSVRRAMRATVQPQLRTMAQPLLVAMPLLFAGMLLGGASPVASAVTVLLLMAAAFVASVVAGIVAIYCFKR